MGERFELDVAALQTVAAGFVTSAAALDAAVAALRSRDERFAAPVRAWAEATRSNADRLERTTTEYLQQERENVGAVGGADR
ncbi:hypothetical protein [Rhodococcus maanshanensis]|uniref:Excreted virulence factor EspC, type VII ESX diderm n=1 Tax=Rhodococcus maanshanensis TaxID=183556 RepID=A0A1H7KLH0_9NOCA|nr:hypothetical protein [Rhodococcus maanshanensis]SEK87366.1 hypothetical protein SAMN05444583_10492 [Rhodococcus maanshanensis]